MLWWRPTYPPPSYRTWSWKRPFRIPADLVDRFFLVTRFPEPFNDRDSLKW